jgi:hypothetical protein
MASTKRHSDILNCILAALQPIVTSLYPNETIEVRDYNEDEALQRGIFISPIGSGEQIGTNERDDIDYTTLIVRNIHALGNDDLDPKSCWHDEVRRLFHNKRLNCGINCQLYSRLDFGNFSIPAKWKNNNTSAAPIVVRTLVRESRT